MTKINNGFSLFDFCKKRADKLQIYGEETLDEEGNIIPFIDQAALITHYLQLRNKNVNMPYEQQAKGILELWYEFVRGEQQKKYNPQNEMLPFHKTKCSETQNEASSL